MWRVRISLSRSCRSVFGLCLVPLVALSACGSADGKNSLTSVTPSAPDATCPAGGVTIKTGIDTNGNGVLDDSEATATNELCSGAASAPGSLVATTSLPSGDPNCAAGGVAIQRGLDNGAGGGIAGDGILQAGEVTATQYVCNGTTPTFPGSTTQPPGAGTNTIVTAGGDGTTFNGGSAGNVDLTLANGSLGGHVKLFKSGTVDASFTMPAEPAFHAGSAPATISIDTRVKRYAATTGVTDAIFLVDNDPALYVLVGGVATPATSLSIAAGKTVTFEHNSNGSTAAFTVVGDVKNAGTITSDKLGDAKSLANVQISCASFYGEAGSSVALAGAAAAGSLGGAGGSFFVYANAHVMNQGTITTTGGTGDDGGLGGAVRWSVYPGDLYNMGAITADGGVGAVGGGGGAGTVVLESGYRTLHNAGAISASGGNGVTFGGNGNYLALTVNSLGALSNNVALQARGGTCSAADCDGGSGGPVYLQAYSADLLSNGDINTAGADAKGTGAGGDGGALDIYDYTDTSFTGNVSIATGSVRVAGNLVMKGGAGARGGGGGHLALYDDPSNVPQGQEIVLYGYTDIKANGGNSTGGGGGRGGRVSFSNAYSQFPGGGSQGPGGGVINYASVSAKGGNGQQGGRGGNYAMSTQTSFTFNSPNEIAANFGATFDLRGGSSSANGTPGAVAGSFRMIGVSGVENHADVNSTSGSATGANADGGSGPTSFLEADTGPATNTGAITVSGGTSASRGGGFGGGFHIYGTLATNSGALTSNGGNGMTTGGGGGSLELNSSPNGPSVSTGAFSVVGGTGTVAGTKGNVTVDGANVTP
jgi:hypothetical protein